ncbi:OadG family protein [Amphritea sp. 1_MG-2023]|uniref:OadG family protein n=1 Tax=Amphritea sp. 1_MG-2023 TaxID=3062670 RepID=UPI0026E14116|nr:OadG family protein [Amphritea sp. 1_MG-2023]MDO6562661.1 OadG family protein [Amphritea sp. 1_MG-2023]
MDNLMSEGLSLMVFGMGFVFVFLTLLVFATGFMSKLIAKVAPEAPPQPVKQNTAVAAAPASEGDELIAVMTAAVHQYRKH